MIKRLTLTAEHLQLISIMKFEPNEDTGDLTIYKDDPYRLSGRLEDIAIALGMGDKIIPGTEFDPEGAAFPDDVEQHLLSIHKYISDNLYDIEVLIHQFAVKGGLQPGTYKAFDYEEIWTKEK